MKTNTYVRLCFLILATGLFFSCIGPEGPQGPAGYDGVDGNANVKSATFDVYPADWSSDGNYLYVDFKVDIITSDIASYGAVLVYFKSTAEANTWQMLPYTWPDGDYTEIFRFWYKPQYLTLEIYNPGVPLVPDIIYTMKVVAIADFYAKSSKAQALILQQTNEMISKNLLK